MFKTLLFAGLLAVAIGAPAPGPNLASIPALAPAPSSLISPLGPNLYSGFGGPILLHGYPTIPLQSYVPPPVILKNYVY